MNAQVRRYAGALALAGHLAMVTACSYDGAGPTGPTGAAPRIEVSDEALFRGMFFGEGAVGDLFPEIWQGRSMVERAPNAEGAAFLVRLQNSAVATLRAEDPDFFSTFAGAMRSGDHHAIDAALQDAGERLQEAFKESPEYARLPEPEVATYVHVAAVIALVFILWIIDFTPNLVQEGMPQLKREQFVDMVAHRLRPSTEWGSSAKGG